MKKFAFLLTFLSFVFLLNAQVGQFTTSIAWTNGNGSQSQSLTVYVPTTYSASIDYSLVIGFHGLGDTPGNYINSLLAYANDSYYGNVIVVAPSYSDWDQNYDDTGIIPATIAELSSTHSIDLANVYVQGFSVGGRSAVYQGLESADDIKGIIAHSPAVCEENGEFYNYANSDKVLGCTTASPTYEQNAAPGCIVNPSTIEDTFWWIAGNIADNMNTNGGNAVYIDNPNNSHSIPPQVTVKQCWDHVSQTISLTTPIPDFEADNTGIIEGASVIFTDNSDEGGAAISSWEWVFTGGSPASFTGQNPPAITYNSPGSYEVSLTVTNSFGPSVETKAAYITVQTQSNAFSLNFEACTDYSQSFQTWISVDGDGELTYGSNDFDFPGEQTAFGFLALNPADAAVASPIALAHGGDRCGLAVCPTNGTSASDNWLISPQLTLGTGSEISLWTLSAKPGTWGNDTYEIAVSTTDNSTSSFSPISSVVEAPASWTQHTYDLSAYDGQQVYIAVHHVSTGMFLFLVDDIEINTTSTDINSQNDFKDISVYPNPSNGEFNIKGEGIISYEIINVNGEIVDQQNNNSERFKINLENHAEGIYYLKLITNEGVQTKKLLFF